MDSPKKEEKRRTQLSRRFCGQRKSRVAFPPQSHGSVTGRGIPRFEWPVPRICSARAQQLANSASPKQGRSSASSGHSLQCYAHTHCWAVYLFLEGQFSSKQEHRCFFQATLGVSKISSGFRGSIREPVTTNKSWD